MQKKPEATSIYSPYAMHDYHDMPYRRLGQTGLRVSNVGLGTWKMGYPDLGDGSRVDEKTAFAIFDEAIEQGVTFWDTANRYNGGTGNAEVIIGRWFEAHPEKRADVVLATKVHGGMDGMTPNHCGLSRLNILRAVDKCLYRLQTDYIDLLYFHRYDSGCPADESLEAVEDLVRAGKVRYFGVSNFTRANLAEYRAVSAHMSARVRIAAVQNDFNIVTGEKEAKPVLPYCAATGMSYVAYSPLARGLLTGRYKKPEDMGAESRMQQEGLAASFDEKVFAKVRALGEVADDLGISMATLTLAYMLTLDGMGPVIPSSSSPAQLIDNAAAGRLKLSEETCARIRKLLA